jgi:hypothetical protein
MHHARAFCCLFLLAFGWLVSFGAVVIDDGREADVFDRITVHQTRQHHRSLQSLQLPETILDGFCQATPPTQASSSKRWSSLLQRAVGANETAIAIIDEYVRQANPIERQRAQALAAAAGMVAEIRRRRWRLLSGLYPHITELANSWHAALEDIIALSHELGKIVAWKMPASGDSVELRQSRPLPSFPLRVSRLWRDLPDVGMLPCGVGARRTCSSQTCREDSAAQVRVLGAGLDPSDVPSCGILALQVEQVQSMWFQSEDLLPIGLGWWDNATMEARAPAARGGAEDGASPPETPQWLPYPGHANDSVSIILPHSSQQGGDRFQFSSPRRDRIQPPRLSKPLNAQECPGVVIDYASENADAIHARMPWLQGRVLVMLSSLVLPSALEATGRLRPAWRERHIPILFFGVISPRRALLLQELQALTKHAITVANGQASMWGHDRDALVARSRVLLNIKARGPSLSLLASGVCGAQTAQRVADAIGADNAEKLSRKLPSLEGDANGDERFWRLLVRSGQSRGSDASVRWKAAVARPDGGMAARAQVVSYLEGRARVGAVQCDTPQVTEWHRLGGAAANAGVMVTEAGDAASSWLLCGGKKLTPAGCDAAHASAALPALAQASAIEGIPALLTKFARARHGAPSGSPEAVAAAQFAGWQALWSALVPWWASLPFRHTAIAHAGG